LPSSLVTGSDGNIWFSDQGTTKAMGVVCLSASPLCTASDVASHAIHEFSAGLNAGSVPGIPTFGPDGNTWFADGGMTKAIGRINVSTHAISEFSSGLSSTGVSRVIAGPDGNGWFVDKSVATPAVGRITPSGVITEFPITTLSSGQFFNAANFGPDGGLWIGRYPSPAGIARFDITTHVHTTISNSLSGLPGVIVAGPDLNMWTTDSGTAPGFARVGTGVCDDSLEGCHLQLVNLQNIVLVGADLQDDHLQQAQLQNVRLIGASLQGAHLQEANLGNAQLQYAHLEGAHLQGADLSGANLTGADLSGAHLGGATLTGVVWSNTTCPDGTNSNNDGGTCANNE
jgi:streptogramin lyase